MYAAGEYRFEVINDETGDVMDVFIHSLDAAFRAYDLGQSMAHISWEELEEIRNKPRSKAVWDYNV